MLRFETAGESHGECLVATLTGLPAGIPISVEGINRELWRRQQGYGRGGRMKIETDRAEIVAGVRHSHTIGSPVAILIRNQDWENWTEVLPVEDTAAARTSANQSPVRGPGMPIWPARIKYNFHDARYILERASARETAARVAVGRAWPRRCWREFGIEVLSHVIAVGAVRTGAAGGLGGDCRAQPEGRRCCWAAWTPPPKPHEGSGGRSLPHGRHRGRRLRSGGARRCRPAWDRTPPGIRAWTAGWRRPSSPSRR